MRHTVHESLDFTPKGNRAERVQTVNVKAHDPEKWEPVFG